MTVKNLTLPSNECRRNSNENNNIVKYRQDHDTVKDHHLLRIVLFLLNLHKTV
jgi:hypothetical protein